MIRIESRQKETDRYKMRVKSENWRKRHAVQVVAMLPDDPVDALAVLEYARELVENFLGEARKPQVPVLAFSDAASKSLCAKSG